MNVETFVCWYLLCVVDVFVVGCNGNNKISRRAFCRYYYYCCCCSCCWFCIYFCLVWFSNVCCYRWSQTFDLFFFFLFVCWYFVYSRRFSFASFTTTSFLHTLLFVYNLHDSHLSFVMVVVAFFVVVIITPVQQTFHLFIDFLSLNPTNNCIHSVTQWQIVRICYVVRGVWCIYFCCCRCYCWDNVSRSLVLLLLL